MATEAPLCPKCESPLGTPVNAECGVEPGRFDGPPTSNLFCPSCGIGWIGDYVEVADAWRAFVEYEQSQVGR
jgi:RNase P subunit RPR2